MTATRLAVLLITLSALSACTSLPKTPAVDPAERQAALEALSEFGFSGGLGIWTDEQSMSARIGWQQAAAQLTVQLTGPMGIGKMQLIDSAGSAFLSRGGNVISSGPSVDTVLQRGLGLSAPVPVQQLKQWVKGLPGNATSLVTDTQGKLASLRFTDEQGTSWQARFLKYSDFEGLAVPSLITASGGPYSVRLVLKNWQPLVHSVVPDEMQSDTRLEIPSR